LLIFQAREVVITNFYVLPDDQRLRAARAEVELFQVLLTREDDEESVRIKAMEWTRKVSDDVENNLKKLNSTRRKVDESEEHKVGDVTSEYLEAALTSGQLRAWWVRPLEQAMKEGNSHHLIRELGWKSCEAPAFLQTALSVLKGLQPRTMVSQVAR
jgi:hypothetical protein